MGRYQRHPIMNIAWPITALYSGPIALFIYFRYTRLPKVNMEGERKLKLKKKPRWLQNYVSSTHCGAGCALADIVSEVTIFWVGITILGKAIWASFFIDLGAALAFGFIFQYFSIKPMHKKISFSALLYKVIKADTLSLLSFQAGMYGWLLAVYYMYDGTLNASSPTFWFMMQIALTIGLITTYPVNSWLIRSGIKSSCA